MVDHCSVGNRHTLCFIRFHSLHWVPPSYQGAILIHYPVILHADLVQADLHMSQVEAVLPITFYVLGFGFGYQPIPQFNSISLTRTPVSPLIFAPLSEVCAHLSVATGEDCLTR